MINKKLVYNKKTDNGLDSLYKNIEKDDETPLKLIKNLIYFLSL